MVRTWAKVRVSFVLTPAELLVWSTMRYYMQPSPSLSLPPHPTSCNPITPPHPTCTIPPHTIPPPSSPHHPYPYPTQSLLPPHPSPLPPHPITPPPPPPITPPSSPHHPSPSSPHHSSLLPPSPLPHPIEHKEVITSTRLSFWTSWLTT